LGFKQISDDEIAVRRAWMVGCGAVVVGIQARRRRGGEWMAGGFVGVEVGRGWCCPCDVVWDDCASSVKGRGSAVRAGGGGEVASVQMPDVRCREVSGIASDEMVSTG
jgi:hypothetical protein